MRIIATMVDRIEKDVTGADEVKSLISRGFVIDSVDDEECVGMCEICGMPITESQQYETDCEGIAWHKSCAAE